MKKDLLASYLASRAVSAPWRLEGDGGDGYAGCVVIPALGESARLFATLESLAANPARFLERFLVVVVVNHREDAQQAEKEDNAQTLARLRTLQTPLRLCFVDAAGVGLELPSKSGGVGLARKIGMDLALPRLGKDGMIVCLDADTLVEPGYLPAIDAHFAQNSAGGAVIDFRHQAGATPAEQRAITLYELYLRHYVQGLARAGSPYAFHCVGSAMACTARAYLKMGGMNSRCAGEDFYFLQQLQRTAGIARVRGTAVHPSARSSHRVPFGTGKSISRILAEGEESQTFYRVECFRILEKWLSLVQEGAALSAPELLEAGAAVDPQLEVYLRQAGFERVWERLREHASGADGLRGAFHGWFDALKTVRLVHHLSLAYPRCGADEALPPLLEFCDLPAVDGELAHLRLLRKVQTPVT
jgi:hypothetical protein